MGQLRNQYHSDSTWEKATDKAKEKATETGTTASLAVLTALAIAAVATGASHAKWDLRQRGWTTATRSSSFWLAASLASLSFYFEARSEINMALRGPLVGTAWRHGAVERVSVAKWPTNWTTVELNFPLYYIGGACVGESLQVEATSCSLLSKYTCPRLRPR